MHRLQVIKQIIIPRRQSPAPLCGLKLCPSLVFPWAKPWSRPGAPDSPRECFVSRAGVPFSPRLLLRTPIRFPILLPRLLRRGDPGGRLGGRNPILCSFLFSLSICFGLSAAPALAVVGVSSPVSQFHPSFRLVLVAVVRFLGEPFGEFCEFFLGCVLQCFFVHVVFLSQLNNYIIAYPREDCNSIWRPRPIPQLLLPPRLYRLPVSRLRQRAYEVCPRR